MTMNDPTATSGNDHVEMDETDRLIASDKVAGTDVYGRNGDHLGSVYNFMVDKRSGQVAYAVMSFGGFLGIGEKYHPIPWNRLSYDPQMGGYVISIDTAQLQTAPMYGAGENPWRDPNYGENVAGHYGEVWTR